MFVLLLVWYFVTSADNVGTWPYDREKMDQGVILKIFLGFNQVIAFIPETYTAIVWPENYVEFVSILSFVVSPVSLSSPGCASKALSLSALGNFWTAIMTFPALLIVVAAHYFYKVKFGEHRGTTPYAIQQEKWMHKAVAISWASMSFFLVYPNVCVSSIRLLAQCKELCADGTDDCTSYLPADFSVECGTPNHTATKYFAAILGLGGFCIVAPAVLAWTLWKNEVHKQIPPMKIPTRPKATNEDSSDDAAVKCCTAITGLCHSGDDEDKPPITGPSEVWDVGLAFLYRSFKPSYFFWESVDLYRKLLITGIVTFISPGTITQICVGIIFASGSWALESYVSPYQHHFECTVSSAALGAITFKLILGALLASSRAEQLAGLTDDAADGYSVGATLCILAGLVYFGIAWVIGINAKKGERKRDAEEAAADIPEDLVNFRFFDQDGESRFVLSHPPYASRFVR